MAAHSDADPSSWIMIEAIIATSDVFETIDGPIALHPEVLHDLANALNAGTIPMLGHHDHSLPIRTRNAVAEVLPTPRGTHEVRVRTEVAREDRDRIGPVGGFSFSGSVPLSVEAGDTVVGVSAEGTWYTDEVIRDSTELIARALNNETRDRRHVVSSRRLFQFSALPDAKIVIETTVALVNALGPNLVASAIWDGVKLLWNRRRFHSSDSLGSERSTVIDVAIVDADGTETIATIRTNDQQVAHHAVSRVFDALQHRQSAIGRETVVWTSTDNEAGGWCAPR